MQLIQIRRGVCTRYTFAGVLTVMPVYFIALGIIAELIIIHRVTAGDPELAEALVLATVLVYLGVLIVNSADQILPVHLEIRPEGLVIERTVGGRTIPWCDIQKLGVTVMPGLLCDGISGQAASRVGLGIHLRGEHGYAIESAEPEIVVVSLPNSHAKDLLAVCAAVDSKRSRFLGVRRAVPFQSHDGLTGPGTFGARA